MGRCESCPSDLDEGLLVALKEWRSGRAKEQKVPAYVVFSDNTLIAIAEQQPEDVPALVAIPGIGAKKLDRYGSAVVDVVTRTLS